GRALHVLRVALLSPDALRDPAGTAGFPGTGTRPGGMAIGVLARLPARLTRGRGLARRPGGSDEPAQARRPGGAGRPGRARPRVSARIALPVVTGDGVVGSARRSGRPRGYRH